MRIGVASDITRIINQSGIQRFAMAGSQISGNTDALNSMSLQEKIAWRTAENEKLRFGLLSQYDKSDNNQELSEKVALIDRNDQDLRSCLNSMKSHQKVQKKINIFLAVCSIIPLVPVPGVELAIIPLITVMLATIGYDLYKAYDHNKKVNNALKDAELFDPNARFQKEKDSEKKGLKSKLRKIFKRDKAPNKDRFRRTSSGTARRPRMG